MSRTVAAPSAVFTAIPTNGHIYIAPKTDASVAVALNDVVLASNTFVYYPAAGFAGIDAYSYAARDGVADDSTATTVKITVVDIATVGRCRLTLSDLR